MADRTDYLLDEHGNWKVVNGDFVAGDSTLKEVQSIAELNQGEVRSFPLIGPNLVMMINSNSSRQEIEDRLAQHLKLDGLNYQKLKRHISIKA